MIVAHLTENLSWIIGTACIVFLGAGVVAGYMLGYRDAEHDQGRRRARHP